MSNIHKNPFCPFAEQLVAYLYGESDEAETRKFQTHLEHCVPCADELKSFGLLRAAVSEWRDSELAQIPTPIFSIPEYQSKKPLSVGFDSELNSIRSRFNAFRQLFQLKPLTAAMAAFGIIISGIGLFLWTFNFDHGAETAKTADVVNVAQVAVSPTAEIIKKPETFDMFDVRESNVEKSAPKSAEVLSKKVSAAGKSAVKISLSAPKNNADHAVRKSEIVIDTAKKPAAAKKPAIPNLNDSEDEADETIRLADLFAELDTK